MSTSDKTDDKKAVVVCAMEWSRDAAEKVKTTIEKAFYAGLLGDNWTVKVQRRDGGKLKVYLEAEDKQG